MSKKRKDEDVRIIEDILDPETGDMFTTEITGSPEDKKALDEEWIVQLSQNQKLLNMLANQPTDEELREYVYSLEDKQVSDQDLLNYIAHDVEYIGAPFSIKEGGSGREFGIN